METQALPYYCFKEIDIKKYYEGRFWNQGGKQMAVVAVVTQVDDRGDWAAYIGADARQASTEEATLNHVAEYGCKLTERDAQHFFPLVKLPYRW